MTEREVGCLLDRLCVQLATCWAGGRSVALVVLLRGLNVIARLRDEIARRLPFEATIVICRDREILKLVAADFLARQRLRPDMVRFVGDLSRVPRAAPRLPMSFPPCVAWLQKVLAREGAADELFGVPATTRGWSTITAIARVLKNGAP